MFFYRLMTRGDHLVHCISYALIRARKVVKGLSLTLSKDERKAVAERAVDELRRNGDWWKLDEELPEQGTGTFTRRRRTIDTNPRLVIRHRNTFWPKLVFHEQTCGEN